MVPSDGSDIISYPYEHDKPSMRDVIVRASIIPLANYNSLGLDAETVYSRKEGRKEIRGRLTIQRDQEPTDTVIRRDLHRHRVSSISPTIKTPRFLALLDVL